MLGRAAAGRTRSRDTSRAGKEAVQHAVRRHVLQRREAGRRHLVGGDPLDGLQAVQVDVVVVGISQDQIRLVRAAHQAGIEAVPVALDVGRRESRAALRVRGGLEVLVAPETPGQPVDAAHGPRGRGVGDEELQAPDLLAAGSGAIGVHVAPHVVDHRLLGVLDARGEQVDDRFRAGVLHGAFQPRDGHGDAALLPVELRCGEHVRGTDVQHFVARVVLEGRVLGVLQFLDDGATAGDRLDRAALLHAVEERDVLGDVVRQLPGAVAQGRGDDFGQAG